MWLVSEGLTTLKDLKAEARTFLHQPADRYSTPASPSTSPSQRTSWSSKSRTFTKRCRTEEMVLSWLDRIRSSDKHSPCLVFLSLSLCQSLILKESSRSQSWAVFHAKEESWTAPAAECGQPTPCWGIQGGPCMLGSVSKVARGKSVGPRSGGIRHNCTGPVHDSSYNSTIANTVAYFNDSPTVLHNWLQFIRHPATLVLHKFFLQACDVIPCKKTKQTDAFITMMDGLRMH